MAECYVADEIITSAAGVRVRVGNTDAEGRMAMADPLHHMIKVRKSKFACIQRNKLVLKLYATYFHTCRLWHY